MSQANNGGDAYIRLLLDILPLLLIAFGLLVLRGLSFVRKSYLQRGFFDTICNVLFSSAVMAAFSVGVVLCIPLLGVEMTPHAEVGLTVFLSAGGMKLFDAIVKKRFGLHTVDFRDGELLEDFYKMMSEEQRQQHMDVCPFCKTDSHKKDCDKS